MKRLIQALLVILGAALAAPGWAQPPRYAVALGATPVLNTPDFVEVFSGKVKLDPCQGVRPIEFVALPGTLFAVQEERQVKGIRIYRVTTRDYPYPTETGYFIDARFVKPAPQGAPERKRRLPSREAIQEGLLASLGRPYVWGGNLRDGVPMLKELYPGGDPLVGVDCSGLLYEATGGYTPRNTSALVAFGSKVKVAGLPAEEIAAKVQPLDLIVWKGHVMIVLDRERIVESTMGCEGGEAGVHFTPLKEGLRRLMKVKKGVDDFAELPPGAKGFVVRRWYPPQR